MKTFDTRAVLAPSPGFTLLELVVVVVVLGIMAVVVIPRFEGALSLRSSSWRDEVQAGLRHAQKSAVAHRRLVCASVRPQALVLAIARTNPATACAVPLSGPEGGEAFATTATAADMAISPSGPVYFQPDGRATLDGAGAQTARRTIVLADAPDLTVEGDTGFVH